MILDGAKSVAKHATLTGLSVQQRPVVRTRRRPRSVAPRWPGEAAAGGCARSQVQATGAFPAPNCPRERPTCRCASGSDWVFHAPSLPFAGGAAANQRLAASQWFASPSGRWCAGQPKPTDVERGVCPAARKKNVRGAGGWRSAGFGCPEHHRPDGLANH